MKEPNKSTVDITLLEELRTDKEGNEEYKKIQMVVKKISAIKSTSGRKWILPAAVLVSIFMLIAIGKLNDEEQTAISRDELVQMFDSAEQLEAKTVPDLFEP